MIALNEFLTNIDKFKEFYKLINQKINFDIILKLSDKLKLFQLETERNRSMCNKLCGEIISLKSSNLENDCSDMLKKASKLDHKSNKLKLKTDKLHKKLDFHLKNLPNLPDKLNLSDIEIQTKNVDFDRVKLESFLSTKSKMIKTTKTINDCLKQQSNKIFDENELPMIVMCNQNILILCTNDNLNCFIEDLITFMVNNSNRLIEKAITNLNNSSSQEYEILSTTDSLFSIEVKREYFSREFKIKYHDISTDSTKFVNQINIIFAK